MKSALVHPSTGRPLRVERPRKVALESQPGRRMPTGKLMAVQEFVLGLWRTRPVWPASQNMPANWPGLAEAGGRPEILLALAWCAGAAELAEASGRLLSTQRCA